MSTVVTRVQSCRFNRKISKKVREYVNMTGHSCPIVLANGFSPPIVYGRSYHWTTKTGKPVYYPSAYVQKGGSFPNYHASTLRIVVGIGWLIEHGVV